MQISLSLMYPAYRCSSVRSNSASARFASLHVVGRQKAADSCTSSTAFWGSPSLWHTDRKLFRSPSL